MSGSNKCDNLISNLLYIAKDELDFDTKNCNIEIETLEINHGNFVITITKYESTQNKLKVKRKQYNNNNCTCIYESYDLNNYFEFINYLIKNFNKIWNIYKEKHEILKSSNKILLIIDSSIFSFEESKIFNSIITEFAIFKSNSAILISKLKECQL